VTDTSTGPRKRSLLSLISDIPGLLSDLVRQEIEQLKQELTNKLKLAGVGIGLIAVAGAFVFSAIAVFTAAAVLGLATVLPAWAAALIVGGVLLLLAALLIAVGVANVRKSAPLTPTNTISSVKQDVTVITGTGKRAKP
jgi:hypothetical protein